MQIYLFKLYTLEEFKDFNTFVAMEMVDAEELGISKFEDLNELEEFMIEEINSGVSDYVGDVDKDVYIGIIDLDKQTMTKKIYTVRLDSRVIKTDEEIQKLIDAKEKEKEENDAELKAKKKETNIP